MVAKGIRITQPKEESEWVGGAKRALEMLRYLEDDAMRLTDLLLFSL